jgi:predicted RNase H-like nuclease (RuvC/YqgF family)
MVLIEKMRESDEILQDFKVKYSDKCRECASLIQISEHRLEQYNDMIQKKKDMEETQAQILDRLNGSLHLKDEELSQLKRYLNQLERDLSTSGNHTSHENDILR